jgi:UDP:flavonoid glycosyltransferase YjiC (YdhE family)
LARIVLNTFGSFGDLHPYLALAIELRRRGHQTIVATAEVYRTKVEAEGVEFAPVRPNVGELLDNPDLIAKLWDPRTGSEFLIRDYVMPQIDGSYDDLLAACLGADLLLTHAASYAGPVVAEKLGLRWLSVVLQPMIFVSRYDAPVLPGAAWLKHLYGDGGWLFSLLMRLANPKLMSWSKPLTDLRQRLSLPPSKTNPILEGQFSPFGTLAFFSEHFAKPQPDWPPHTAVTGFISYDKRGEGFGESSGGDGLARFLENGPAPVLFTLGSSAVMNPGTFYQESLAAAQSLGVRAVLLIGKLDRSQFPSVSPERVHFADYAPYSEVMPKAAVIVHQGGIGTTAQALRAGRPTIVVPWSHDQPDNAERLRKLGVSRTIPRSGYTAQRAARELERLLNSDGYRHRAAALAVKLATEDGLARAADACIAACPLR